MEPRLAEREQSEEETRELLALAGQLEGLTRNVGMHAGGVLIAPGKLTDFCPLYAPQGAESVVSQFDMKDVEAVGLVKFDFLGLTTLTILDWAMRYIRGRSYGEPHPDFSLRDASRSTTRRSTRYSAGANTTAVFQFESRGMRDLLKQARPDRFEDIIALVALYRPGPMDLIPEFIERKHGQAARRVPGPAPAAHPRPDLRHHGLPGAGDADRAGDRRLQRSAAPTCCAARWARRSPRRWPSSATSSSPARTRTASTRRRPNELFDLMEKFAGYGFNKSHAAAYALVACQTAYLKAHFPSEFMAANMSAVMDDTDKVHAIYVDALAERLEDRCRPTSTRRLPLRAGGRASSIRYGLGAIKGTGEAAIGAMVARARGGRAVPRPVRFLRARRQAPGQPPRDRGAGEGRRVRLHRARPREPVRLGRHRARGGGAARAQCAAQVSLFGDAGGVEGFELNPAAPWGERERLQNEKQSLGYYLSGHPFNAYRDELRRFARTPLAQVAPQQEPAMLAGVIHGVQVRNSRRGRMAVLTLDDGTARLEVVVFGELFQDKRAVIQEDQVVVVRGRVFPDEFSGGLRITADQIMDLAEVRAAHARLLRLSINGQADSAKLKALLAQFAGGQCHVAIRYRNAKGECDIRLPESCRVKVSAPLLDSLSQWLDEKNVEVVY